MKTILFSVFLVMLCILTKDALAQPATFGLPVGIGRNNCGGSGFKDSLYYFNYVNSNLTNATTPPACFPVLKPKPFSVTAAGISFNPKDQMYYYQWVDFGVPGWKTYIWRWSPTACPSVALDTLRTFPGAVIGITFDANGVAWQMDFSATINPLTGSLNAYLMSVDFATGAIGIKDTMDLTGGAKIYNANSGDITMMPSGQMYYVINNKLFTPDYGSYGGSTHHITCTYIDTIKKPTGSTNLVGLAFADGDIVASYSSGCYYSKINPITGDTGKVTYTYPAGKGIYSVDMTQINTGVGASKKLVSVTSTGTPNQYDVVYDIYTRNYGNTPISNVQVTDNLASINGLANVSNVTASLTSNPAGVTLNPLYNGTAVLNLLSSSQNLPCFPVANNNFTIRISCRLSNILSGVVYNNSAVATATGFNGASLRDSSTNGSNPDLNQNDKTDDNGEGQPTPFVIILTPTTPPCAILSQVLYTQDFGTGNGMVATLPPTPSASTGYIGSTTVPLAINNYAVSLGSQLPDPSNFVSLFDHTVDVNGRMMVVNADAASRIIYADTLPVSCPGQQYSLSFWAAFIGNNSYKTICDGFGGFKYPIIRARIRDLTTGLIITQFTTDSIKLTNWQQLGMKWVMPSGYSNVIMELLNAGPGGCGNDFALDDIQYGVCDPSPFASLSAPGGCIGTAVTFTGALSDTAVIPGTKDYQWQVSPAPGTGPWTNVVGATAMNYTINPVNAADTGKFYRVIIAAQGNIGTPGCQYISPGLKLIGFAPSTAPTSVSASSGAYCNPGSATLTAVGGTLGTGANYQWGTGSVVGTNPIAGATSSALTVSPASTTTYWVQIQNTSSPCAATTGGVTQVITVNQPSIAPSSISGSDYCNPGSATLTAVGGTLGTGANYQWGTGAVVGTNPIAGATSSTLTVSPASTTTYWVQIQNTAAPCTDAPAGLTKIITVKQPSVAAVSATKNKNNICPGISVTLTQNGGSLGTGASWKWYTGSPGGTLVGSGTTLVVTPAITTTYYVRAEGDCNTTTDQQVTVFISCDIDKDKDGIPDFVESNMSASFADANGNGIINAYDPSYAGYVDNNNDFINDDFQADGDSDNDGIPNYSDATFPGRIDTNADGVDDRFDTDLDGKINMLDLDSDNDGIPDVVEAYGVDTNGDGKIDTFNDTDGDGLTQSVDINNTGANNTGTGLGLPNLDGDGVPNFLDIDSDNDGIPDVVEAGGPDTNNNGIIDGFIDANGDGLHDNYINATALLTTGADGNGDGKADSYPNKNKDRDFLPNAYDIDSDADGILDVIEAGLPDVAAPFGVVDGVIGANGWSVTVSSMPALNLRVTDGDAYPDYLDIDSDNDGIPDNIEGLSTVGYKLPALPDTDGDGLADTYETAPSMSVFGGAGTGFYDHDGDGIPDYRDLDTDADGYLDIIEGNDFNLNGRGDDLVTLTGLDTDGDGLDNRFDSLTSVTNIKGTSYMMGTGGTLTGDAAPGSRCTVQKKTVSQTDRDWRSVGVVLPVEFLGFTGLPQNTQVALRWSIITPKDVDHFEIERSIDNNTFIKVGVVNDAVKLNQQQSFGFIDDIAGINSEIIYYRLKVIGKAGEFKYSNVLVVRRNQTKTPVSVMPNPANDYVSVRFFVEQESIITIRLVDNLGKTVLLQKQKASKGINIIQLDRLTKYSSGVYSIQLFVNGEIATQKLIISR